MKVRPSSEQVSSRSRAPVFAVTGQFSEPVAETLSALVAFSDPAAVFSAQVAFSDPAAVFSAQFAQPSDPAAGTSSAMSFAAAEDLFAFAFETHSSERRYR